MSLPIPTTVDSILEGRVRLEQPAPSFGYRFNADSVLLAQFAHRRRPSPQSIVDLGAGVGTVGIIYAVLSSVERLCLIDMDETSCELARRNARQLPSTRISVHRERLSLSSQPLGGKEKFEAVVANPPYAPKGAARPPKLSSVEHSKQGSLEPFLYAASRLLTSSGALFLCYPASSLDSLLSLTERFGLHPLVMQFVHANAHQPARLVLVEAALSMAPTRGATIEPPIFDSKPRAP